MYSKKIILLFSGLLCLSTEAKSQERDLFISLNLNEPLSFGENEPHFPELIRKANRAFQSGLYEESLSLNLEILNKAGKENNKTLVNTASSQIALIYLITDNTPELISFLRSNAFSENSFFLGLAYNKNKQYEKALSTLNEAIKDKTLFSNEANFEIGKSLFLLNRYQEATNQLNDLLLNSKKSNIVFLAQLYLAKIKLKEKKLSEAEKLLNDLDANSQNDKRSNYEVSYLKGDLYSLKGDYDTALRFYEKAKPNIHNPSWKNLCQLAIAKCTFNLHEINSNAQDDYLTKAQETLESISNKSENPEACYLLLKCYLTQGKASNDLESYNKAEQLYNEIDPFLSPQEKQQALLLQAEFAPTYEKRERLFQYLTHIQDSPIIGKAWLLKGLNDLQEADQLEKTNFLEAKTFYEKAVNSFEKATSLLEQSDPKSAALAFINQITALLKIDTESSLLKILDISKEAKYTYIYSILLNNEFDYLQALAAYKLYKLTDENKYLSLAENNLLEIKESSNQSVFFEKSQLLLGKIYLENENYSQAKEAYLKIYKNPNSEFYPDTLFWLATCEECLSGDKAKEKQFLQELFEKHPQHPLAANAYFNFYSFQEYLQGDRNALKHLNAFGEKFQNTPLLLQAYYLIGLDNKRDRKSGEGKILRKKNLTTSIDAFQKVDSLYEEYKNKQLFENETIGQYTALRYRAILEKSQSNISIALESQGTKNKIYLSYALDVLNQMNDSLSIESDILKPDILKNLKDETLFWLAYTYRLSNKDEMAEEMLNKIISNFKDAKIYHSYYLSKAWIEKGLIDQSRKKYHEALVSFTEAEESAKGKFLSTNQKLNLWLNEYECYKALSQLDKAHLILSKIINDDSVSQLRLKAMLLRAELFEQQDRYEQARRQLVSLSKKGGIWAEKAKLKLEKEYGY